MNEIGAAAISGGLGLIGSVTSGIFAGTENRKNRKWQEKMYNMAVENNREDALQAHEWQKELQELSVDQMLRGKSEGWSAEVEGLRAAGLNPMLALNGSGVSGAGGVGAPSSAQANPAHAGNPATLGMDTSGFNQAGNAIMQTQLIKSEAELNKAKADEIRGETAPIKRTMEEQQANIEEINGKINLMLVQSGLFEAQGQLYQAQKKWQDLQNAITEGTKKEQMEAIKWGLYSTRNQYRLITEEIKDRRMKRDNEIKLMEAQINLFNKNAEYLLSKIGETEAYKSLLSDQGTHQRAQNTLLYAQFPDLIEMTKWQCKNEKEFRERYEEYLRNQRRGQNLQFIGGLIGAFAGAASGYYRADVMKKMATQTKSSETYRRFTDSNGNFTGGVEEYKTFNGLGL